MTAASRLYARSRPRSSEDERFLLRHIAAERGDAFDYALDYADASCVRATAAWLHDKHIGSLTQFGANEARIRPDGAIVVEGTSTNICLRSRDLTASPWAAPNDGDSVQATTEPGPDGAACGGLVTLFGRGGPAEVQQNVSASLSSSTRYTLTAFLRRFGPVSPDVYCIWENKAGSSTVPDVPEYPARRWRRTQPNTQDSATGGGGLVQIASPAGVGTDRFFVDFVQLEALDFASSPIVTAGVSATRNADGITLTAGNWNTDIGNSPWSFWFEPAFGSYNARNAGNACVLFSCNSGNDRVEVTSGNVVTVYDNGSPVLSSDALVFDPGLRIRVDIDPDEPSITVSGAYTGNGKRLGLSAYSWSTSGSLTVSQTSPGPFWGVLSRPRML